MIMILLYIYIIIWGFYYKFTNYNVRETLDSLKNTLPEGRHSALFLKLRFCCLNLFGEIIVTSPQKGGDRRLRRHDAGHGRPETINMYAYNVYTYTYIHIYIYIYILITKITNIYIYIYI